MMKKPNRISMALFDEELKALINASAKIFPITQNDVDTSNNPNSYEYGRVDNHIYRWGNNKWEYIIADDKDISFLELKDIPTSFNPKPHNHNESDIINLDKYTKAEVDNKLTTKADKAELHNHANKSILDTIIQNVIDKWNSAYDHISDLVKHITSAERTLWNTVSSKSDKTYVDTELGKKADTVALNNKADAVHNHDGAYYKKGEVDTKLGTKAEKVHTHDYSQINHNHDLTYATKATENTVSSHEERLFNIENGYTEGHSHPNVPLLNTITQILIDGWNNAVNHISDLVRHITGEERILWNTVSNKSDSNHLHDDRYYTEIEVDTKLSSKSDTTHTHTDKADKTYVDTELSKKANSTTLSGHTGNSTVHVTQTDKDNWNGKQDNLGFIPVSTTDPRLSDARTPLAHNHVKSEITDFPAIPSKTSDLSNDSGFITVSSIPTSLPANGGNADTVDGKHASDFIQTSQFTSSNASTPINPNNTLVNGMYYAKGISLLGASDGALYNQAYSNTCQGQIFQDYRTGRLATRGKNNGSWTSWREVLDTNGGTMAGALVAQTNANYTTRQVRNMIYSTANPSGGANGDLWIKYKP